MDKEKELEKLRINPNNTHFNDFERVIEMYGFRLKRSKGSYFSYSKEGIDRPILIQNRKGKAKSYQIKQFIKIIEKYSL